MNDTFKDIQRCEATKNYNKAFTLCIENLCNNEFKEIAIGEMRRLTQYYSYQIFEEYYYGYRLVINKTVPETWLIDIAIDNGYIGFDYQPISIGLFSEVPGIILGSFLAKHKYGLKINNKKNRTTIYYMRSPFCDDDKMITAICEAIILLYTIE